LYATAHPARPATSAIVAFAEQHGGGTHDVVCANAGILFMGPN
jgi:hypothetical protein